MAKKKEVPSNNKRKPTLKKSFSLNDFKKKSGSLDTPDKPLRWLKCSDALQKAIGLPGFPVGYVSLARGYSNTGKSTAVCEGIVAAQKAGMLPIIIDTENNIGTERLKIMGFDWDGEYILIDNEYLLENFGIKRNKDITDASIEDLGDCMKYFLKEQEMGNLPRDIVFAIDSFGTLNCTKSILALENDTASNNMWNAGAYESRFMELLNNRIPNSRKMNKEFTNTVIGVQKIWLDSMNGNSVRHKGGNTTWFTGRLIIHFGGVMGASVKNVTADSKKRTVTYGTETKVNVIKNHIDGPLGGISLSGNIMSMPHGFIFKEDLDKYKKDHILYFRNILGDHTLNAEDIVDGFVDPTANVLDELLEKAPLSDDMITNFENQKEDEN